MFALGIRYLNGWSMAAADGANKQRAEWPPHPDRVFMALAAAWLETGGGSTGGVDEAYRQEGEALRWLEALSPPAIAASDAATRTPVASYVPVNDAQVGSRLPDGGGLDKLKGAGLAVLPEHRSRQPRGFPVAIPHDPTVHLIWREAEPDVHRAALERLAAKVTHVGHSASFVQAWVEEDSTVTAVWEPVEGAAVHRLRIPSAGRLDGLIRTLQPDRVDRLPRSSRRDRKGRDRRQGDEASPEDRLGGGLRTPCCWLRRPRPGGTRDYPGAKGGRCGRRRISGGRPGRRYGDCRGARADRSSQRKRRAGAGERPRL